MLGRIGHCGSRRDDNAFHRDASRGTSGALGLLGSHSDEVHKLIPSPADHLAPLLAHEEELFDRRRLATGEDEKLVVFHDVGRAFVLLARRRVAPGVQALVNSSLNGGRRAGCRVEQEELVVLLGEREPAGRTKAVLDVVNIGREPAKTRLGRSSEDVLK